MGSAAPRFRQLHRESVFLRQYIFANLGPQNRGLHPREIAYFNCREFLNVIARCDLLGVAICRMQVFDSSLKLLDLQISDAAGASWCRGVVRKWQSIPDTFFSAVYGVRDDVLRLFLGLPDCENTLVLLSEAID